VPRPLDTVEQSRPQDSCTLPSITTPPRNAALALSFRYPVEQIVLKIYNAPRSISEKVYPKGCCCPLGALKLVNAETRKERRQGKDNRLQMMINRQARVERDAAVIEKLGEERRGRIRRGLTVKRVLKRLLVAVKRIKDERGPGWHEIQQGSPSDNL